MTSHRCDILGTFRCCCCLHGDVQQETHVRSRGSQQDENYRHVGESNCPCSNASSAFFQTCYERNLFPSGRRAGPLTLAQTNRQTLHQQIKPLNFSTQHHVLF
jgi:hypothetical protein